MDGGTAVADFLRVAGVPAVRHVPEPGFQDLERRLARAFSNLAGFAFPCAFRELYRFEFELIDCGLVRFLPSSALAPLKAVESLVFDTWDPPRVAGAGLVPIADEGHDGGPLCLDAREPHEQTSFSVVLWDHEAERVTRPLYDDVEAMLHCAAHVSLRGPVRELARLGGSGAADYYAWMDD